ncbi:MAG: DbpA RNA binding domain-containing protein [Planctomycetota bacterium]
MDVIPPLAQGFMRLELRFRLPSPPPTPGDVASATGLHPDEIGPVMVAGLNAVVDVRHEAVQRARDGLAALGIVRVADWNFRWIRLSVGRNHGLTIGQLRKLLVAMDAMPLGKFNINNTHTMIGILDQKVDAVAAKLADQRINGTAVRPEVMPMGGKGLGSASFGGNAH